MNGIKLMCAVCLSVFFGCKAGPGKTTEFFGDTNGMVQDPTVETFHKVWVRDDVDWYKFKKIFIAPVNTQHLRKMSWWGKITIEQPDEEGMQKLAEFTRQAFIEAHRKNKHKYRLEVVDKPDADTVIIEIALTEVVPTKVWLNAVAIGSIGMALDKGLVAMESRIRDGGTWEVIGKVADREMGKENIINVKDITWYGHAKSIIREWAQQSVDITNAEEGETIKDSSFFELKPW